MTVIKLPLYQVDAFTGNVFSGSPAAVCLLPRPLEDHVLLNIAAENNLPETAFLLRDGDRNHLRWFTPEAEVDLCGHATLATAYVYLNLLEQGENVSFETQSGTLSVHKNGEYYELDLPSRPGEAVSCPMALEAGLGKTPREVYFHRDYLAVFESEAEVRALAPNMEELKKLDGLGVIATAKRDDETFVSRFFAPKVGLPEDPATGSSHCQLTPYWAKQFGRNEMKAFQLSKRGGEFFCTDAGDRVKIAGRAALYLQGEITIPL